MPLLEITADLNPRSVNHDLIKVIRIVSNHLKSNSFPNLEPPQPTIPIYLAYLSTVTTFQHPVDCIATIGFMIMIPISCIDLLLS
ncbi:Uncharacterised protein [Zhongshania aliphaticivorans]|uniref:Uncharacterized protein n=1 Tax=Zhongshania aliphaticivorans TaxID=1470434 RepID=A0A5S9NXL5_9GAMM|nr:Uncharacterised protein [Zhongshania aliphaticivorans]CAA0095442.1 Uncharacterised protein [Zhongshania aliphaticivorans]